MDELFEMLKENPHQFRRGLELFARGEKEGIAAIEQELAGLAREAGFNTEGEAWEAVLAELRGNQQEDDEEEDNLQDSPREIDILPQEAMFSTGMSMLK